MGVFDFLTTSVCLFFDIDTIGIESSIGVNASNLLEAIVCLKKCAVDVGH